jgi:pyridoxamine 5'-phosphate oxidase
MSRHLLGRIPPVTMITLGHADIRARQPESGCLPADPFTLFREWAARAVERGVPESAALVAALATADAAGRASNRIVRALQMDDYGLVFTSHLASQKAREIAQTGWASAVLWWPQAKQQVIICGPVEQLPDAVADGMWASRPLAVQAMSASCVQSAPLADEESLRAAARRRAESGEPLPRPSGWLAYRLVAASVEFWESSPDGLHRRLRYDQAPDGWTAIRLQP